MPTINKGKKTSNYVKHDKAKDIYRYVYNTSRWRKLRQAYLMMHPLCEMCLDENIINEDGIKESRITEAKEVHHITPISNANDELSMKELGYNPDNLMSVCEFHHHQLHNQMK